MKEKKWLYEILNANDKNEAFTIYVAHLEELKDYAILFTEQDGKNKMPKGSLEKSFPKGAKILPLFAGNSVFVFDHETILGMLEHYASCFGMDIELSMDTNVVSYLMQYQEGKKVPEDFTLCIDYLIEEHLNYDPMHYFYENVRFFGKPKQQITLFSEMLSYNILRTLDKKLWKERRVLQSTLTKEALIRKTDYEFQVLQEIQTHEEERNYLEIIYRSVYLTLLKMVEIQLLHPKWKLEHKMQAFLSFFLEKTGTIPKREFVLAYHYFQKTTAMLFFRKIQKGKDNLPLLKNMAWDLFHIRMIEKAQHLYVDGSMRIYMIPSFLTFDRGLQEVLLLCPVSRIAYDRIRKKTYVVYQAFLDLCQNYPFLQSFTEKEVWLEKKTVDCDMIHSLEISFKALVK